MQRRIITIPHINRTFILSTIACGVVESQIKIGYNEAHYKKHNGIQNQ